MKFGGVYRANALMSLHGYCPKRKIKFQVLLPVPMRLTIFSTGCFGYSVLSCRIEERSEGLFSSFLS